MGKPRFFIDYNIAVGETYSIGAKIRHHIKNGLRLRKGDEIILVTPHQEAYTCSIDRIYRNDVKITVIAPHDIPSESPLAISLGIALIQNMKMDMIIRQVTELGVTKICPFESAYTQLKKEQQERRYERWRKIIKSSCEQSGRTCIPKLEGISWFDEILTRNSSSLKIIAWEKEKNNTLKKIHLDHKAQKDILIMVGPEGSFTDDEIQKAKNAGFFTFSLGPRILRCETAAVVSVAIIQHYWGDLC